MVFRRCVSSLVLTKHRYLKETNMKNNPEELNSLINKLSPSTLTWTPKPGAVLDLGLAQKNPNDRCVFSLCSEVYIMTYHVTSLGITNHQQSSHFAFVPYQQTLFTVVFCHYDSSMAITDPPPGTQIYMDTWDFDLYVNNLNAANSEDIFKHESWIQFYYRWAGFQDYNLVVRVTAFPLSDQLICFASLPFKMFKSLLCTHCFQDRLWTI